MCIVCVFKDNIDFYGSRYSNINIPVPSSTAFSTTWDSFNECFQKWQNPVNLPKLSSECSTVCSWVFPRPEEAVFHPIFSSYKKQMLLLYYALFNSPRPWQNCRSIHPMNMHSPLENSIPLKIERFEMEKWNTRNQHYFLHNLLIIIVICLYSLIKNDLWPNILNIFCFFTY